MNDKKIVELLKLGDFTILYHDNGSCSLYEGRFKNYYEKPEGVDSVASFDCDFNGYLPKEVALLVKALGGCSDSV